MERRSVACIRAVGGRGAHRVVGTSASTRYPRRYAMASSRKRVVVIGGGFGGLNVTEALADANVDITLIDRTNHHLFQPLLYQVAAGIMAEGLIAPALRHVVRKQRNVEVLLAEV